ncbi:glycerol kinase GlpK [Deinococcus aquatilis]|jgi:glycerol kinase|uniref:glycerol kinase GlpK n=1 Tax=Deinococcus aquatilis TaxID=519440 RepID=UPI00036B0CD6|nr:glycerol kinase GlpK [Deinococcus aquatilis]
MSKFILALDQGTTSSRAIVFDRAGAVVAAAQKEFTQFFPQPGWVEHDAQEIWGTQVGVAQEALTRAGLRAADVAAIGITNQRETVVVWERASGRPIHRAIVWQDRRTAPLCDALRAAGHEATIQAKTGLVLDAYFSGTKVAWLLDQVPGARQQAERGELAFGTMDSWLVYNLTGGELHITDASNASRTLLFNIHTGDWDDELLALLNVPRAMLPQVRASSEVYGETAEGLLGARVPIAGIAGDQQAATFGQVCLKRGMAKNTYGTGCFLLMNTARQAVTSQHRLLTTVAWRLGQQLTYALEGSVFTAGATVQWLRDGLGIIRESGDVEALAASVSSSGGVTLVPAFAGLGAPHWDPHARGTMLGLTRGTTAAHIARAALEGVTMQVAEVLAAMEQDVKKIPVESRSSGIQSERSEQERIRVSGDGRTPGGVLGGRESDEIRMGGAGSPALTELRVDGGGSRNDLMMQLQADIVGVPVVRPRITETTALGAAYLAGLAVGYWQGTDEIAAQWQEDRTFEPRLSADERGERMTRWSRAVLRAKDWADQDVLLTEKGAE